MWAAANFQINTIEILFKSTSLCFSPQYVFNQPIPATYFFYRSKFVLFFPFITVFSQAKMSDVQLIQ